jgi:NADP-dependent 3-hydroxy acid dehydrogenase YdfG
MANTILVTGAGRGLGRVLTELLTARGDRVIAHARSESALNGLDVGQQLVADLSEPEALAAAVERAGIERLDALVHNAGIANVAAVGETPVGDWRETLAVNLVAPAELTRLLLPALRAANGHVVFVNSGAGIAAGAGWGQYAASKHGLKALADALRAEERGNGLRVTSVYPSHFDTDMQREVREAFGADYDRARATSAESIARVILGVLDAPDDMVVNDMRVEPPNPLPIRPA